MKKPVDIEKFYSVLIPAEGQEATILLYGPIGNIQDWETGEQLGVTDLGFVQELNRLAARYPVIRLRINSVGGSIFHGSPMITAIQNCKAEVHTYVDGLAASMAGALWLAGKHRHMAKNGLVMLHAGSNVCWGNAQDLREAAQVLDTMTETLVQGIASCTGIEAEDIRSRYFADYKDHWLSYDDCLRDGLITEKEEEYQAAGAAEGVAGMAYNNLLKHLSKPGEEPTSLLDQVRDTLRAGYDRIAAVAASLTPKPIIHSTDDTAMTIEQLKASLADGTLKPEEVLAALDQPAEPAPAAPTATAEVPVADPAMTALQGDLKKLNDLVEAQGKLLAEFGAKPGAGKSTPGLPENDVPTEGLGGATTAEKALASANEAIAKEIANGGDVRFASTLAL